ADLVARGKPRGLDVEDVVQIDAGDGKRFQVIHGAGFLLYEVAERGVLALEEPGDKGREAAGFLLQLADAREVVDAMLEPFSTTEHHGGSGAHTELVRD